MFPKEINDTVKNIPYTIDNVGRSHDTVYVFQNKYILKVSDKGEMLLREKQGFDFLCDNGVDGCKSICFTEENGKYYYLRTMLCGDSLISERFINNPDLLSDVLTEVFGVLRSLDNRSCPFSSTDSSGNSYVHGDLCLPNIYVSKDNRFLGFIDVGNSGIGDRWYDYAWLLWSMEYNLGSDKYGKDFLKRIGVEYNNEKFCQYIPEDMRGMKL